MLYPWPSEWASSSHAVFTLSAYAPPTRDARIVLTRLRAEAMNGVTARFNDLLKKAVSPEGITGDDSGAFQMFAMGVEHLFPPLAKAELDNLARVVKPGKGADLVNAILRAYVGLINSTGNLIQLP